MDTQEAPHWKRILRADTENPPQARREALLAHVGPGLLAYLEDQAGKWHNGAGENMPLRRYLGLTLPEYQVFVLRPADLLVEMSLA